MVLLRMVSSICVWIFVMAVLKLQDRGVSTTKILLENNVERFSEQRYSHVTFPYSVDNVQKYIQQTKSTIGTYSTRKRRSSNQRPVFENASTANHPQPSPCSVSVCGMNTVVDCVGLSLMEIHSTWFPRNTTVILLDKNIIETIRNSSFSHLTDLRVLSLANNNIKEIEYDAFRGLNNLETINLESNKLARSAFTPKLFGHLVRLKELRIRQNKIERSCASYFDRNDGTKRNFLTNFFQELQTLTVLTMDVPCNSFFNDQKLPNLNTLILSGSIKMFDAESFKNVKNIANLVLEQFPSTSNFSDTALQPLHSLNVLKVTDMPLGLKKALAILKPLVGKNMSAVYLNKISLARHESYSTLINNEGILDFANTKHLTKICVRHFSLTYSRIFVITANALFSDVWDKCLHSLDMSNNALLGTRLALVRLLRLRSLQNLTLETSWKPFNMKKHRETKRKIDFQTYTASNACDQTLWSLMNQFSTTEKDKDVGDDSGNVSGRIQLENASPRTCFPNITSIDSSFYGYPKFYISRSLKYIKLSRIGTSSGADVNIQFVGAENLIYLDLSNNGMGVFLGNIIGLGSLKTFILSGNYASLFSETFFDGMCHIEELDLSNAELDENFMSNKSDRVFQNLRYLKRLDVSSNFMYSMKFSTFVSNGLLEELYLSKNRFRSIPFELKNTPKLKFLDLRENSITSLQPRERHKLDELARQPGGFTLLIAGNILSCGCDSFGFLYWLKTTYVQLDNDRNFTCMNNEGELSSTNAITDLEALWRKCWAKFFLSLALILLFSMAIGFLSIFSVWKNKTFITSKILQMLTGYKLKELGDYQTGVYIGYADKDYRFPCLVLRPFIEDEIQMSTYVSDRDMDPSRDMASSIVDAINDSWRILLVFSENFLFNDQWSLFTIRTAMYAQSPVNPARVVVLVQENLRHRLPAEVLSSVPEDNIVVVPEWEMSYELREKLRTRLM